MKNMMITLATVAATLVSLSAIAEVIVPYGQQWTSLPNCGGYTRLTCQDVSNARARNLCKIEFYSSYNCTQINLYVKADYYPKAATVSKAMDQYFYVDNAKVNPSGTFRTYMQNDDKSKYEQVTYRFGY